jgi:hypothetical protein
MHMLGDELDQIEKKTDGRCFDMVADMLMAYSDLQFSIHRFVSLVWCHKLEASNLPSVPPS